MSLKNAFLPVELQDNQPYDFKYKLIFFGGIEPESPHHFFNERLLFITDARPDYDYVIGFCINNRLQSRLYSYIGQQDVYGLSEQARFLPVLNGSVENFHLEDENCLTYLVKQERADQHLFDNTRVDNCGEFTAFYPEDWETSCDIAKEIAHKSGVMIIENATMLVRQDLTKLVATKKAFMAPANPEAMFHPNIGLRAHLAFKEHFASKEWAPQGDILQLRR